MVVWDFHLLKQSLLENVYKILRKNNSKSELRSDQISIKTFFLNLIATLIAIISLQFVIVIIHLTN